MPPMIKISDITTVIEEFAPLSAQESYDNCGLILSDADAEIDSALLCVDVTEDVVDEAIELGCKMIISHHPLIFHPIKQITTNSYIERAILKAIKNSISIYACHTNLDKVDQGLSYVLAHMMGMQNIKTLLPQANGDGFGAVGELSNEVDPIEFLHSLKELFNLKVIRHSDIVKDKIKRIAVCSGSGASHINDAKSVGADLFIAADFKYNDFFNADKQIIVADIGHFESEYCAINTLFKVIRKKMPTFALHKSKYGKNPVNYIV